MIVTARLQIAMAPRTGTQWVESALNSQDIPYTAYRGKHRVPDSGDISWDYIPDSIPRFTVVRDAHAWLKSIYRVMRPTGGSAGIPEIQDIVDIEAKDLPDFLAKATLLVPLVWEYFQPASYVGKTESLAKDFCDCLESVGYEIDRDKLMSLPPKGIS